MTPPLLLKVLCVAFPPKRMNTNDVHMRMCRPQDDDGRSRVWGHILPDPNIETYREIKLSSSSRPTLTPLNGVTLMVEANSHTLFSHSEALPRVFYVS